MHRPVLLATVLAAFVSGCAVAPAYQRPSALSSAGFKEAVDLPAWKYAEPKELAGQGRWWHIYGNERLNALLNDFAQENQTIRLSEARYRQALALANGARAGLLPALNLNLPIKRSGDANGSAGSYRAALDASWEIDLWGRVRSQIDSNALAAEAGAADLAAARLSVQAGCVQTYFQVRIADAQQRLLDDTVLAYERSLELTQNRYRVGVATRSDVAQAEAQLKSTQALAIDNRAQRAQLEHALAVLLGKTPAGFALPAEPASGTAAGLHKDPGKGLSDLRPVVDAGLGLTVPVIPPGIPSDLLERRPDIAAAERRVAAANAAVGIARAAVFPNLTLAASGGLQSSQLSRWLSLPSRVWSLGPALAAPLFDGGLRRAQTEAATASYDATVAAYRQTVLNGVQEVEDNLTILKWLAQEQEVLDSAVGSAREAEQQILNRYKAGTVDYLSVATVQATALSTQRNALAVMGRRLIASAGLVKALGGGWNQAQ